MTYDVSMVGEPAGNTPHCPPEVLELIERFRRHHETYKQASYNETQVRHEFIDPFFAATNREIDQLVYKLYELTDDEIKIVEEATGRSAC